MHPGYHIGAIYLHRDPVDFRKQANGLAAIVEGELEMSPFADALFLFINRARTSIKALYWDRNGFCLWQSVWRPTALPGPGESGLPPATRSVCASLSGCSRASIHGIKMHIRH